MPQSVKREQLVDTALRLFYRDGFHATGIDKILAEAGVARMTLYKHFKSKDDLVLAALRRRDEQFRTWFERAVEQRGATPRARLVAIFDALDDWFAGRAFPGGEFHGCAFVNAAAEFSDPDQPAHRAAAEHKRLLRDYTSRLAAAAGADDPAALAGELMLLAEGATVTAHVCGDRRAARRAKAIAEDLIARRVPG